MGALGIAYLLIGAVFAICTWLYAPRSGDPSWDLSGFMIGLLWPLVVVITLLSWWTDPFRSTWKDHPND